jgi:hypothetical protein
MQASFLVPPASLYRLHANLQLSTASLPATAWRRLAPALNSPLLPDVMSRKYGPKKRVDERI